MVMFRFKGGQHTSLRVVKMHCSRLVSHVLQCWGWIDSWLLNLWDVCVWWELGKDCFFGCRCCRPLWFYCQKLKFASIFGGHCAPGKLPDGVNKIKYKQIRSNLWSSMTEQNLEAIFCGFFKHLTCQHVSEHKCCWNLCSSMTLQGHFFSQDIYGLLWSNWMSKLLKLLSLRTKNRFYRSYRMVFLGWHWCRILGVWLCSHKKWSIFPYASSFPRSNSYISYQKWGDISIYHVSLPTTTGWQLAPETGLVGKTFFSCRAEPDGLEVSLSRI